MVRQGELEELAMSVVNCDCGTAAENPLTGRMDYCEHSGARLDERRTCACGAAGADNPLSGRWTSCGHSGLRLYVRCAVSGCGKHAGVTLRRWEAWRCPEHALTDAARLTVRKDGPHATSHPEAAASPSSMPDNTARAGSGVPVNGNVRGDIYQAELTARLKAEAALLERDRTIANLRKRIALYVEEARYCLENHRKRCACMRDDWVLSHADTPI